MKPLALALAILAVEGAASADIAQVFRAGTDTVLLNVTVADGKHQPVSGLRLHDFQVFEDGVLQQVSVFASDPQPIALSLLIDSSVSMDRKLAVAQEAAVGFVRRLRPQDVAQVISFDSDTEIRQPFTSDISLLESAIRGIRQSGSTSLYTAVYIALTELRRIEAGDAMRRQAIVLLSDGEDTGSLLTSDEVIDAAKRANVMIYTIALREKDPAARDLKGPDYALRTLTQVTGGRLFMIADAAQLPTIYQQIADELANQYVIGFASKNTRRDGTWRIVSVRVARPSTGVRTRAGYFAPRSPR